MDLFNHNENLILSSFEDIHNQIYANEGLSPEESFNELIKLLFNVTIFFREHKSTDYSEYRKFITDNKYLKKNFLGLEYQGKLSQQLEKDIFLKIVKLELDQSNDILGLGFQKFLNSSSRINRGQFFTPKIIVDMCVEMIELNKNVNILDPCCGSGSFLVSAYNSIKEELNGKEHCSLYGMDISKQAILLTKLRFMLLDIKSENIFCSDALSDVKLLPESFDIILTNPPFGTKGKITDHGVLRNYDLAYKYSNTNDRWIKTNTLQNGVPPERLFIERCIRLLKPNGKIAIVLPDSILENPSMTYMREYILSKTNLLKVIKLPSETFMPSGTAIKTSILILQKKPCKNPNNIFFGAVSKIGFQGNKNATPIYKKDSKGNLLYDDSGNFIVDEDVTDIIKQNNVNADFYFLDSKDLDKKRFDFEYYHPKYLKQQKIPKSFSVKKMKEIVKVVQNKSPKLRNKELEVNYIELSDINYLYSEIVDSESLLVSDLPSRASYELKEGQIITAVAGNSIGTKKHVSAIVTSEYNGAICTNGFKVLEVQPSLSPYYLIYFFRSSFFLNQITKFRVGSAIPVITDDDFSNLDILIPNKKLHQKISDHMKSGYIQRQDFIDKLEYIVGD